MVINTMNHSWPLFILQEAEVLNDEETVYFEHSRVVQIETHSAGQHEQDIYKCRTDKFPA